MPKERPENPVEAKPRPAELRLRFESPEARRVFAQWLFETADRPFLITDDRTVAEPGTAFQPTDYSMLTLRGKQ